MDKILFDLMQVAKETRGERGRKVLQDLHKYMGFDFCKPLKAVKFHDSFTKKSLKDKFNIDCSTQFVVIIFVRGRWLEVAEYTDKGVMLLNSGMEALSKISTKSEFEDLRKWGGFDVYAIAQDKVYRTIRYSTREFRTSAPDINERYNYWDEDEDIKDYIIKRGVKHTWENRSDRYYTIDKSGYPVSVKRELLGYKARQIKTERNAKAYKEMKNTKDMIAKAKQAIELKKIELSKRLLSCDTSHDINEFSSKLSYFSGLYGCYMDIERIEERDNNKLFSSPEQFNRAIGEIYNRLATI